MKRPLIALLIAVLVLGGSFWLLRSGSLPEGRLLEVVSSHSHADSPSITWDGELFWTAWLEYSEEQGERLLARSFTSEWEGEPVVVRSGGAHHEPQLASDGSETWLVWSERSTDGWDLFGRRLGSETDPEIVPLTQMPGAEIHPRLVASPSGHWALLWRGRPGPSGEPSLWLRMRGDGVWGEPEEIPHSRAGWRVDAAFTDRGDLWIAFDHYRGGESGYDVAVARRSREGDYAGPWALAATERFEAHPRLAVDETGAALVAWDQGGARWGQEGSTNREDQALHLGRSIRLVRLGRDGEAEHHALPGSLKEHALQQNIELPQPVPLPGGEVALLYRAMDDIADPRRRQRFVGWQTYLASAATEQPLPVGPPGRGDQQPAYARSPGRLVVAQSGDAREREAAGDDRVRVNWFVPITPSDRRTFVTVSAIGLEQVGTELPGRGRSFRLEPLRPLSESSSAVVEGPAGWQLLWGDLHRHTEISRCSQNLDGTIEDAYRYAWGPGGLDFVALTDHSAHLTDLDAWRLWKSVDLYHLSGSRSTLWGYEWTSEAGHKNVISPQPDLPLWVVESEAQPGRGFSTVAGVPDLFEALRAWPGQALAIPHTPAGMNEEGGAMDWSFHDAAFERVVEIFQSYRGSYESEQAPRAFPSPTREGTYVTDALDRGYRLGFIASSDHQTSGGAFVGVLARDRTRAAIFEALHARRCFAATDKIALSVRAGEVWMGGQLPVDTPLELDVRVHGTVPIESIDIIADGAVVDQLGPFGAEVELTWKAAESGSSEASYHYVRVLQQDGEMAWSSPIWRAEGSSPAQDR